MFAITVPIIIGAIAANTAIIAAIAIPVAIIGADHVIDKVKEMKKEDQNEGAEIPNTGSSDNSGVAALIVFASASLAFVAAGKKKRKEDEE